MIRFVFLAITAVAAVATLACSKVEPAPYDAGDIDEEPDGGASTAWPEGIDCDPCAADEVCRYTYDVDNDVHTATCVARPAACAADATCDCIAQSESDADADAVCAGVAYNSDSCSVVENTLVVYCEVNLG